LSKNSLPIVLSLFLDAGKTTALQILFNFLAISETERDGTL